MKPHCTLMQQSAASDCLKGGFGFHICADSMALTLNLRLLYTLGYPILVFISKSTRHTPRITPKIIRKSAMFANTLT